MTTLYSLSQSDDVFVNNYHNINSSSDDILQEYETVSQLDLFHSSQPESFKDIERQRRAIQSHVIKKNKLKAKAGGEKLEQRRKRLGNNNGSSSSSSSSASESDHDENAQTTKGRNARLSTGSDTDRKKGNSSKKSSRHGDRSNKRADRHRRPEDEIFSSSDDSGSDSEEGDRGTRTGIIVTRDDEVYEERIRFKHNLNFKTDDDSEVSRSSRKLNADEWKQAYVQKLDEKDQHRAQQKELQRQKKHSSRS